MPMVAASGRPALAHRLWVLLLIKLMTPPLAPLSFGGGAATLPVHVHFIFTREISP